MTARGAGRTPALRTHRLNGDADIARVAGLIGDGARAAMLWALCAGRPLPAGDLAACARVTPQTASSHLAKLLSGGLVEVEARGRLRYYRIAGPDVARALETLATIAPLKPPNALSETARHAALRAARSCYDHLAGRLAVDLLTALLERDALRDLVFAGATHSRRGAALGTIALGGNAEETFAALGIDLAELSASGRQFAPLCLDWTERVPHLGGALGAALCAAFLRNDWCRRALHGRALVVTAAGRQALNERVRRVRGSNT